MSEQHPELPMVTGNGQPDADRGESSYIEVDGKKIAIGIGAAGLFATIAVVAGHELRKYAREHRRPSSEG